MDEQSNNWRSFVGLANCPRGPGVPYHLSVFLVCFSFCLFLFILFASSGVWMLAGPVASGQWQVAHSLAAVIQWHTVWVKAVGSKLRPC